jgi:hypothetical protein
MERRMAPNESGPGPVIIRILRSRPLLQETRLLRLFTHRSLPCHFVPELEFTIPGGCRYARPSR